jgi:formate hydrogenlyase transcriptional activator
LHAPIGIHSGEDFDGIVGQSAPLQRMLADIKTVAPSYATVLILGETGTGKELVARAIHRLSSRRNASFIKLNCAALPSDLLESELFGYEKGAFTNALTRKIGRLELADRGTLFLDEIADLPIDMQAKLLRVLQDQEFERLGSTQTIRLNARVIAATNQDLEKNVSGGQFRSDLFYRLNIFPIRVPSLRERSSDIPLLVRHFAQQFSQRMNKKIESIPPEVMDDMMNRHWPGNIRELEHFIERAVILTQGPVLLAPLRDLGPQSDLGSHTLESMRRQHIVNVLRETGGVISGPNGAAARLGLKRTTLQSIVQRLGITPKDYES